PGSVRGCHPCHDLLGRASGPEAAAEENVVSISRSPWLFLLLGLLLSATAGVRATIKVEVLEAWPPGDAVVLSTQDSYFLHMAYETDQPVGFWVSAWYRGQQVKRVGSSPSTRYLGT